MKTFVPADFVVPTLLETESFRLRPLTTADTDKDYEAVMSSVEHLQRQIPEQVFGDVWPAPDMTREKDYKDLLYHEKEFERRSSFTYTVMSLDEQVCLGCVYIYPPRFTDGDAEVFLWVRESEYKKGRDGVLWQSVKDWLKKEWPFTKVAYPFRKGQ